MSTSSRSWRIFRIVSAAAACIAVGVLTGWALRDHAGHGAVVSAASKTVPHTVAINTPAASGKVAEVVSYEVKLTDEAGHVTAVQRFDSLKEAREFADDLSNWQQRQRQVRDGAAVVVADRF